ncbi:hypothetical protein QYF36_002315 [Acer negundo]|nr:hypothetical protein QYF36_002315 [Acer negundo]
MRPNQVIAQICRQSPHNSHLGSLLLHRRLVGKPSHDTVTRSVLIQLTTRAFQLITAFAGVAPPSPFVLTTTPTRNSSNQLPRLTLRRRHSDREPILHPMMSPPNVSVKATAKLSSDQF